MSFNARLVELYALLLQNMRHYNVLNMTTVYKFLHSLANFQPADIGLLVAASST